MERIEQLLNTHRSLLHQTQVLEEGFGEQWNQKPT